MSIRTFEPASVVIKPPVPHGFSEIDHSISVPVSPHQEVSSNVMLAPCIPRFDREKSQKSTISRSKTKQKHGLLDEEFSQRCPALEQWSSGDVLTEY